LNENKFNFTLPYNFKQLGFVERDGDSSLFSLQIDDGDGNGDGEWSQKLAGGGVDVWWLPGGGGSTICKLGWEKNESAFSVSF
jgi:hypothetical protein